MTPVLKYPGAKWRLAPWIISYFLPHKVYCEPYAGSAAVLFNKPHKPGDKETLNDIDSEIVNYFRVLKDHGDELARQIYFTPYARDEYNASYKPAPEGNDLERARIFAVRTFMSYGGSVRHKNGFRSGIAPSSPNPAKQWQAMYDTLLTAAERLKSVQIENLPAEEIIFKYNNPETLLYVDPPYMLPTRSSKKYYKHEMTDSEHESLLHALKCSKSMVVLSGYDHAMYNDILRGWNKFLTPTTCEQGKPRIEYLWINYDAGFLPALGSM